MNKINEEDTYTSKQQIDSKYTMKFKAAVTQQQQ